MRALFWLLLSFYASSIVSAAAEQRPLLVEETFLSVTIGGKNYRLAALVAKEAGSTGRLPVALITHGQAAEQEKRERIEPSAHLPLAREFARRGWLAVIVVRRGFGRSDGETPYVVQGCRNGDFGPGFKAQADDLEAAIKAIGRRSDADISTILAVGQSMGGNAVLELAARQPEGLKAVVNFAAGIKIEPRPGKPPPTCKVEDLIPLFANLGERSRLPALWFYSENDSFNPPDQVRARYEAYVAKGGRAQFHMFDPVGEDGHFIIANNDGMLRWLPVLDRFLRANKLRTYDPAPLAAAVNALDLPPGPRQVAHRYDGRPTEKALAVSQSRKRANASFAGNNPAAVEAQARKECEKLAKEPCRIVLRNFEAVPWEGDGGDAQRNERPPSAPPSPTATKGAQ